MQAGSWIPKAFSRPQSETGAGSANPSSPLQARTRFADQPLLAAPMAQPDRQETQPALGPLPSSKAPQETFTALPSLPVPAPITGQRTCLCFTFQIKVLRAIEFHCLELSWPELTHPFLALYFGITASCIGPSYSYCSS